MYPHFLGIGAQKAGTTWLHSMLSMHEDIWLPHLKELHYFDRKFPIGEFASQISPKRVREARTRILVSRLRRLTPAKLKERFEIKKWPDRAWDFKYFFGDWSDEWYASLFEQGRGRITGEITPAYSCLDHVAISHIHSLMPGTKLIFLLRDPVDRAWSHARMDLTHNSGGKPVEISDDHYIAHFTGIASRLRGDYLGAIDRWLSYFPEKQLFLGFYDELQTHPKNFLEGILKFLGVSCADQTYMGQADVRVNAGKQSTIPQHLQQFLAKLYVQDLRQLAKRYGAVPQRWLERCDSVLNGQLRS